MRRSLLAVSVVLAIGFVVAVGPAHADCPADIEAVEERLATVAGREKQLSFAVQAVNNLLDKARNAWSAGQRKKCRKLVKKANAKIDEKLK